MVMTMIPLPADRESSVCTLAGLRRGFVAALPFLLSNGVAGIVMGVAYRGVGLDFLAATLFSLVVYSGTAQAVTLGVWATPPPLAAMILACLGTNARYLVMGAHLQQTFADQPRRRMLPILFWLADASWLMSVAEEGRGRRDAGYLLGASLPMALGWVGGTMAGHALPLTPRGPLAVAAAFLPLSFVTALLPSQWQGARSVLPWTVAAAVSVGVSELGAPGWAMLAGGAAGTLLALLGKDHA
jgi:predicted branched-subunit amino acid permease